MIGIAAILGLIVLAMTGWVTHRVRGRDVKATWVVPLWGAGAIIVLASVTGAMYFNARLVYERCVVTAERSVGGREQTEQLYDTIDEATETDRFTEDVVLADGRPSLRDALDVNLPVLDKNDCPKP